MAGHSQSEPRKTRRTANACVPCRQSKIKCSGEEPCANCQRRAVRCQFTEGTSKVMVSERYLQELQRQAEQHQRSPGSGSQSQVDDDESSRSHTTHPAAQSQSPLETRMLTRQSSMPYSSPAGSQIQVADPCQRGSKRTNVNAFGLDSSVEEEGPINTNIVSPPLTADDSRNTVGIDPGRSELQARHESALSVWPSAFTIASKTIKNVHKKNKRRWIWLAPWSTWSFTVRLMVMMHEKLQLAGPSIPPHILEEDIYVLPPKIVSMSDAPDIRCLPSLDHALYLFNTVKFHLGDTYRFFDNTEFENQVREFYAGNAAQKAAECPLWFAKFLLVLAFGTAFHPRPTAGKEPPGATFFVRAMGLIKDETRLWAESLLATEVLAMMGLYMFSIDQRESGHIYLGHALRIAQFEGLHTQLPEDELGTETLAWCRDLWWTLYIMDRHFSASVGLPMSVQDNDITMTVNPPNMGSQGESARSLQVSLSHLLSVILTTVYKPKTTSLGTYLEQTRSILRTLAHHAQEIEQIISLKFQDSMNTMPKGTRHITLLYHQCVIVATRPLLLSVLKERLDMLGHQSDENWENFLAHTGAIISTGIKSAAKTLQILSSEYSLLEVFLPYDLEFTYGAALHLTMANALFPEISGDQSYGQLSHGILDDMITRGNRVARVRKGELMHLETLCQELATRVQRQGLQTLSLAGSEYSTADIGRRPVEDPHNIVVSEVGTAAMAIGMDGAIPFQPMPQPGPSNMDFLDNIGISSEEFLSIVEQIGDLDTLSDSILMFE